jgi:hypothetical protein
MSPRRSAAINHGVAWFGRPAPSFWVYALAVGRGLNVKYQTTSRGFPFPLAFSTSPYVTPPCISLGLWPNSAATDAHACRSVAVTCCYNKSVSVKIQTFTSRKKKNPNVHVVVRHMRRAHTQCSADTKYKPGPTFVEIELAVVIYPVSKILWLAELTGDTILEVGYIKKWLLSYHLLYG